MVIQIQIEFNFFKSKGNLKNSFYGTLTEMRSFVVIKMIMNGITDLNSLLRELIMYNLIIIFIIFNNLETLTEISFTLKVSQRAKRQYFSLSLSLAFNFS